MMSEDDDVDEDDRWEMNDEDRCQAKRERCEIEEVNEK